MWEAAQKRSLTWTDATFPLFYTLLFAAIWWWNEVYGVPKLREARAQVTSEHGRGRGAASRLLSAFGGKL